MSSRRRTLSAQCIDRGLLPALLAATLAACSSGPGPIQMFYTYRDFDATADAFAEEAQDSGKNRLLYLSEFAQSSLESGDHASARDAFLSGWSALGTEQGSWVRSTLAMIGGESLKVYRGDPYERAMVSIYAGLLLYEKGDYENARAAFKNASLEDSGSEDNAFNADFSLAYLFEALCARKLKDEREARDLIRLAIRSRANQRTTPFLRDIEERSPNLILLLGLGHGPQKIGIGAFEELAVFREIPCQENFATISMDGQVIGRTHEIENLYYQAATRGGRYMDDFLRTKATVKTTFRNAGGAMLLAGVAMSAAAANDDQRNGAGVVILLGLLFYMTSWAITPKADTRHWKTLPGSIQIFLAKIPPGVHTFQLDFFTEVGEGLPRYQQIWHHVPVHDGRDTLLMLRSVCDGMFIPGEDDG